MASERSNPESRDCIFISDTVEILREIEVASGIPFTGLVNNSNLGIATTPETVEASLCYAQEVSRLSGLPVVATSCPDTAEFVNTTTFGEENGEAVWIAVSEYEVKSYKVNVGEVHNFFTDVKNFFLGIFNALFNTIPAVINGWLSGFDFSGVMEGAAGLLEGLGGLTGTTNK